MKDVQSEKYVEKKLVEYVNSKNGECIKLVDRIGRPDRVCLLPDGKIIFVEVKTTNEKPRLAQKVEAARLINKGFKVVFIDHTSKFKEIC